MKRIPKVITKIVSLYLVEKGNKPTNNAPKDLLPFSQPKEGAIKLNIGGGKGHPRFKGWTIVDLRESSSDIIIDISKQKLPFDDNSVDVIFASHILEHIYPQRLIFVLKEFHRVLRPKTGLLRISVPDIKKAIGAYLNKNYLFFAKSSISAYKDILPLGGLLASWFYSTRIFNDPTLKHGDGHVHCFDKDYLTWWLKKTGFKYIWKSSYRGSVIQELREKGFDLRKHDSLFMEVVK